MKNHAIGVACEHLISTVAKNSVDAHDEARQFNEACVYLGEHFKKLQKESLVGIEALIIEKRRKDRHEGPDPRQLTLEDFSKGGGT